MTWLRSDVGIVVGSVVGALGLWAVVVLMVRSLRLGGLWAALLCGAVLVLSWLGPVTGMALALLIALWSCRRSGRGRAAFPRRAAIGLGVVIGAAMLWLGWTAREYDRLRGIYPLVSVRDRLPGRSPVANEPVRLGPAAEERLEEVEAHYSGGSSRVGLRPARLRMLHERSLALFANRLDFGPRRMGPIFPTEANLALRDGPTRQPGARAEPSPSAEDWRDLPGADLGRMGEMHANNAGRFAWSYRSGYVRDVDHVAGFTPHRLDQELEMAWPWEVATVDLVGLDHAEPVVFESPNLPNMAELAALPTRPLDRFEAVALAALRDGDDLMAVRDGEVVRMLGGVRAGSKCLACHQGERGRLLGAFTYTLRRIPVAVGRD